METEKNRFFNYFKNPIGWLIAGSGVLILGACFAVWMSLASCGGKPMDFKTMAEDESPDADGRPILRVAVSAMVSPKMALIYYEDFLRLVGGRLGRRTQLLQRQTYAEVNNMLRDGQVDLAFVCSGPYVTGKKEFGMKLLAVPVVNGQVVYHSYVIVPKDSPARSFADLKGKRFAFTDPDSNTGHMSPVHMLAKKGLTPGEFFGSTSFTYSHDNSIRAVASGAADGAAIDSLVLEILTEIEPEMTSRTKIIGKSAPYGIPPVAVSPHLDKETAGKLQDIFLNIHEDKSGAVLLRRMRIEKFVKGRDSSYDTVREMHRFVEARKVPK